MDKKITYEKTIFFLGAIVAFKDARGESFERGANIRACRMHALRVNTKATTLSAYVSNIKFYYGLNKKSFKTGKDFKELIVITENYSSNELIQILEKMKNEKLEINFIDYLKKELSCL